MSPVVCSGPKLWSWSSWSIVPPPKQQGLVTSAGTHTEPWARNQAFLSQWIFLKGCEVWARGQVLHPNPMV